MINLPLNSIQTHIVILVTGIQLPRTCQNKTKNADAKMIFPESQQIIEFFPIRLLH